ncbi:Uncharacterised protein [Mycobacteroides abscessus subsp. massiliense]|nr:Uncharacterised protein [Mycobacteroides abscessus subsp. massiliense]SKO09322.1 Uncharacterised protein [Mycobacteroides abscessus subsp. massiliense]
MHSLLSGLLCTRFQRTFAVGVEFFGCEFADLGGNLLELVDGESSQTPTVFLVVIERVIVERTFCTLHDRVILLAYFCQTLR